MTAAQQGPAQNLKQPAWWAMRMFDFVVQKKNVKIRKIINLQLFSYKLISWRLPEKPIQGQNVFLSYTPNQLSRGDHTTSSKGKLIHREGY